MSRKALFACSLAVALALPFAASADDGTSLRLEVESDDGDQVRLELASGWLSALVRHATIDCDGSDDRRTRRMARELDRRGEGGVYEFVDSDGDRVVARRSRGQLILETTDDDGDRAVVEMPWALAECWMLGREPAEGLAGIVSDGGLALRIDARDGRDHVHISVD